MRPDQRPDQPPEAERPPVDVIVPRRTGPGNPPPVDEPAVEETEVNVYRRGAYNRDNRARVDAYETERLARLREERARQRTFAIGKAIDAVWLIVGIIEVLLLLRFVFELAGARNIAEFVQFLYGVTDPFLWPFSGIFAVPRHGLYVFDPNILIAMAIYALIGWVLARLLAFAIEPPRRL